MPGLTIHAGSYAAMFRPDAGMLCASLSYAGDEYVVWPRTLAEFRAGKATAMPLVHPWANRLARFGYRTAGRRVDLHGVALPLDPNGLPLHGNLFGAAFAVLRSEPARVIAKLEYGADPNRLRAFPFPHDLIVDARVDAQRGLTIATIVRPTSDRAVPISFGWHPFLCLPGIARSEWTLHWPACEHVELDSRLIPTGRRTAQPAEAAPIGSRTFDDHYALGRAKRFGISAEGRGVTLRFDGHYPFAQLFVPPRRQLVAIEPMTAEINALGHDRAPIAEPGSTFRAAFTIAVTR
ncbi:MAG TPA: aldose 1-epimerase [Acidimicrobiia bacterium]|nr:aldose 1-epimerase [Acidimicrobiia bacterium]